MQISEILKDSIIYPTKSIKSSSVFMILAVIVGVLSVVAFNLEIFEGTLNTGIKIGLMIFVLLISLVMFFLTQGYSLDILKESIQKSNETPNFSISRQLANSRKILIVNIVYFIIPSVVSFFLGIILQLWIVPLLGIFISVVFFLATTMAECRLAKTGKLTNALNVVGTLRDINAIGFGKVFFTTLTIITIMIMSAMLVLGIAWYFNSQMLTSVIISILGVYLLFFSKRALGLLYSER